MRWGTTECGAVPLAVEPEAPGPVAPHVADASEASGVHVESVDEGWINTDGRSNNRRDRLLRCLLKLCPQDPRGADLKTQAHAAEKNHERQGALRTKATNSSD